MRPSTNRPTVHPRVGLGPPPATSRDLSGEMSTGAQCPPCVCQARHPSTSSTTTSTRLDKPQRSRAEASIRSVPCRPADLRDPGDFGMVGQKGHCRGSAKTGQNAAEPGCIGSDVALVCRSPVSPARPEVPAVPIPAPAEDVRQEEQEEAEYPMSEYEQHYQAHKESKAASAVKVRGGGFNSQRPMSPRSRRPRSRCVGSIGRNTNRWHRS